MNIVCKTLIRAVNKLFNLFLPNIKRSIAVKVAQNKIVYQKVQVMLGNPANVYIESLVLKKAISLDIKRLLFAPCKIVIRLILKNNKIIFLKGINKFPKLKQNLRLFMGIKDAAIEDFNTVFEQLPYRAQKIYFELKDTNNYENSI